MAEKKKAGLPAQAQSIRKAVEAIAIKPKSGRLTLLTRKLFNVLLDQAQQQGEDVVTYRVELGDIVANADFDSNDTALIKEHLLKMNQTQVEWNSSSQDGSRRWGVTNLISEAELVQDRRNGPVYVEWSYAPKIKGRLLTPETYARIPLQYQAVLRSTSSLALYEICARYADSPGHLTMREPWEWWRPVLTGIPDGTSEMQNYPEYKYFKRDVVKGAIAEINAVTDLEVELIEHKNGRRVQEIQFSTKKKVQQGLPLTEPALFDMSLVAKMKAVGLSQREVERVYAETEESVIRTALDTLAKRQANNKAAPLTSPTAYFKTLLKSGVVKETAAITEKKKAPTKPKVTPEILREKFKAHQREEAREAFKEMHAADQKALLARFRETLAVPGGAITVQDFDKRGLKSKVAEAAFASWLALDIWGEPSEADLLQFVLEHGTA